MRRLINFLRRIDMHQWVAIYAVICAIVGVYGSVQQMDEEERLVEIASRQ